jgi:hypothetical protein
LSRREIRGLSHWVHCFPFIDHPVATSDTMCYHLVPKREETNHSRGIPYHHYLLTSLRTNAQGYCCVVCMEH